MSEPLAPFQRHSETSRRAAIGIHSTKETLRQMVMVALEARGETGATDDELQEELHLDGSTQRPRRIDLMNHGMVRDSGRKRPTRKGRLATVWIHTQHSEDAS